MGSFAFVVFVGLVTSTSVLARPQSVQTEKQVIVTLPAEEVRDEEHLRRLPIYTTDDNPEQKTKEILDRIGEVNEKLTRARTLEEQPRESDQNGSPKQSKAYSGNSGYYGLPVYPVSIQNPIFELLANENSKKEFNHNKITVKNSQNPNDEENIDRISDGQSIKRKIIHKVNYFVPNPMQRNPAAYRRFPANVQGMPNYQNIQGDSVITYAPSFQDNVAQDENIGNLNQYYLRQTNQLQNQPSVVSSTAYQPQIFLRQSQENPNVLEAVNDEQATKQFGLTWPWTPYFPILIKDPGITMLSGSTALIEYGPNVKICSGTKSTDKANTESDTQVESADPVDSVDFVTKGRSGKSMLQTLLPSTEINTKNVDETKYKLKIIPSSEQTLARTFSGEKIQQKQIEQIPVSLSKAPREDGKVFSVLSNKVSEKLQTHQIKQKETEKEDDEPIIDPEGDIQGDLTEDGQSKLLFGHKAPKPIVLNPGFYINKLRVKKGGVAIAGPGGIATAGGGGTAIVGPEGVAYTKRKGTAVAGPGARIVSLPQEVDLNRLVESLAHKETAGEDDMRSLGEYVTTSEGNKLRKTFVPFGGRIVAHGPAIFHDDTDLI